MATRRLRRPALLALLALGTALETGGGAQAQAPGNDATASARAREYYQAGLRYFNIAEYEQAIRDFKRAYELRAAPELLFNIGQAHRLKGDCAAAMRFYRNYAREVKAPANQAELATAMAHCEKALAAAPAPVPPTEPPRKAEPGPPPPAAPAPAPTPAVYSPDVQVLATAPQSRADAWLRRGGLAATGVGALLIGVGLWQGTRARTTASKVDEELTARGGVWSTALSQRESEGRSAAGTATVLGVGGVAALLGGGALYWFGRRAGAQAQVAIVPSGRGATACWAATF